MPTIRVQSAPFDTGQELAAMVAGRSDIGGIGCFVGIVRGAAGGRALKAMTLEHYPGMTERALTVIAEEAEARWPLLGCLVIHRTGRLLPAEPIVLVATASPHRQAALDSTAFLIDWLKTKAPFWKHEEFADGQSRWVQANHADDHAANRWTTDAPPLPPPATDENSAG